MLDICIVFEVISVIAAQNGTLICCRCWQLVIVLTRAQFVAFKVHLYNSRYNAANSVANVTNPVKVTSGEANLLNAVANIGPISVAIDVQSDFQLYKSGNEQLQKNLTFKQ
jgi:hypothetical protein